MADDTKLDPMEVIKFKNKVLCSLPKVDLGWLEDDTRKKLDMLKLSSQAQVMAAMFVDGNAGIKEAMLFSDMVSDAVRAAFLGAHLNQHASEEGANPLDLVVNACFSAAIIAFCVGSEAPEEAVEYANAILEEMADGGADYEKFSREMEELTSDDE